MLKTLADCLDRLIFSLISGGRRLIFAIDSPLQIPRQAKLDHIGHQISFIARPIAVANRGS